MKKLISVVMCLLIILSTVFCLTGCKSRTDEMADQEIYTEKQMNKMKNKVIKCINEQDKEGLKKLFSKDAQKHIEDLDGKLDQLIGAFNGNKIKSAKGLSPAFEGSADAQPLHIYGDYDLKLSNGENYVIMINICDIDDENKEKEGLYRIILLTFSNEEIPENLKIEGGKDEYGVAVYRLDGATK